MIVLALDTSSVAGSAAIVRDGAVMFERKGDSSRTHGERLPLELMAILREAGVTLDEVDRFAVVTGPGSFTGLRVGIATIQGLALARRKLVTPVSAFEASIFRLTPQDTDLRAVWIDAHRREVFAMLYATDGTPLQGPTSLSPEATIEHWTGTIETGAPIRFIGDGAARYADVIAAQLGDRAILPTVNPPLAGAAGLIAATDPARGVVPHAVVPLYVRRSDAELARDRARTDSHTAAVSRLENPRPPRP